MTWFAVEFNVLRNPCHKDIIIRKTEIIHPQKAGYYLSTGDPQGQIADYRKPLKDGKGIHVREFINHYCIHWDNYDPSNNLVGHLVIDAPLWGLLIGVIGLGILAYSLKE